MKLVGESYPFEPGDQFLLTFDNHNSVNGIREFDRARGARTRYVPMVPPELRVDEAVLEQCLDEATAGRHNLFAYPAQSNFSGVQHPLGVDRPGAAPAAGTCSSTRRRSSPPTGSTWRAFRPDFVALSFYKMFGYPTGVGRAGRAQDGPRQAAPPLVRRRAPSTSPRCRPIASCWQPGAAGFEDGTGDFTNIPAVELGLELLESIGVELIHERVRLLTGWLLEELLALRHGNGRPLVRLYGPTLPASNVGAPWP